MLNNIRHSFLNDQEQLMLLGFGQLALDIQLLHPFEIILTAVVWEPLIQCLR
ncbi:hypothetical protein D3C85_1689740 [compost metagenome]